jgi:hypothetical protein
VVVAQQLLIFVGIGAVLAVIIAWFATVLVTDQYPPFSLA